MSNRDMGAMNELERRIMDVFSEVRSRYPSAEVSVLDAPRRLRLSSTSPDTAALEVIPDPDQVDLAVGRHGRVELLNPSSVEDAVELVQSIAEAVAEGRYEETRWIFLGLTVKSKSRIQRDEDTELLSVQWGLLGPIAWGKKVEVRYASYV